MSDLVADIRSVYRKLAAPFWGFLVFSVLTISGLVYIATQGQDRNAKKASIHLANAAVAATERSLSFLVLEYAYWDQAVENLVTKFDSDWADENIGPYLMDAYKLSSAYVVNASNEVVYGSTKVGRDRRDPFKRFSGDLDTLILKARSGSASAAPIPATGLVNDRGAFYFASVAVLTTYFTRDGKEIDERTGSLLILTKKINLGLLNELAKNYLLHKIHLQDSLDKDVVASIPLITANGEQVSYLVWEPELPGAEIISKLLLGIVGIFLLMGGMMLIFLRRAKNFSFQLSQKSELLKSTLDSIDQGIAAWDDDNRLLTWNAKCEDYWYHPAGVKEGMSKRELLGHIGREGGLGQDRSEEEAEMRYQDLLQEGANSSDEFKLHDGRHITLFRYPMPSGGHTTVYSDITDRKIVEEQMLLQATIDQVTGLPNRALLFDRLSQAMEHAKREQRHIGLIFVDLDFFKQVNDTHGHTVGDKVLKKVGERLGQLVRDEDTVARLGGDEFIILLNDIEIPNGPETVAKKIIDSFKNPIDLGEKYTFVTASLGIAVFPENGEEPETLLQNADTAMYESKQQGRNTYRTFTSA